MTAAGRSSTAVRHRASTALPYQVYDGVYQQPPQGQFFQARLLDNQEGANTERYVFGKLSATRFQRRACLAPTLCQLLWRYRPWKVGPVGCDAHRRMRYRTLIPHRRTAPKRATTRRAYHIQVLFREICRFQRKACFTGHYYTGNSTVLRV